MLTVVALKVFLPCNGSLDLLEPVFLHAPSIVNHTDFQHAVFCLGHDGNCQYTAIGIVAMLDAVFHHRLQDQLRYQYIFQLRINNYSSALERIGHRLVFRVCRIILGSRGTGRRLLSGLIGPVTLCGITLE